jgi:hypothetical protein
VVVRARQRQRKRGGALRGVRSAVGDLEKRLKR